MKADEDCRPHTMMDGALRSAMREGDLQGRRRLKSLTVVFSVRTYPTDDFYYLPMQLYVNDLILYNNDNFHEFISKEQSVRHLRVIPAGFLVLRGHCSQYYMLTH